MNGKLLKVREALRLISDFYIVFSHLFQLNVLYNIEAKYVPNSNNILVKAVAEPTGHGQMDVRTCARLLLFIFWLQR